ncbi:MAG: type II toxin-antitoxin system HicA family toxin [Bacteroidales bacterium]|nr:type II toxin-antitoxin system HicA family toxin [Bacteroidales bacterium]
MKTSELLKRLLDSGCTMVRHGANHDIWYSPITGKRFSVPRHTSKEVSMGTLKDISRKSGIEL